MSRLEYLKKKLKVLKILLVVVPALFALIYGAIVTEFFKTKRELYRLESIELIIEPVKEVNDG